MTPMASIASELNQSADSFIDVEIIDNERSELLGQEPVSDNQASSASEAVTRATDDIDIAIYRASSNSTICSVYFSWAGADSYYGCRFKQIYFSNGSSLALKEYGTFGNGSSYTTKTHATASGYGTVLLGNIKVPTTVTKVYIKYTDVQMLSLANGWISAQMFNAWNSVQ